MITAGSAGVESATACSELPAPGFDAILARMSSPGAAALRIGRFRVDPQLDEILVDGRVIKVEPRTMRLLVCLAAHAGEVVSVEQLLTEVWGDVIVGADSVYQAIAVLRRILGDDAKHPAYIANVMRRGYRLIASVAPWGDAPPASRPDHPQPTTASSAARAAAPVVHGGDKSIAVLPFIDLSEARDQGYLADGMAEEVIHLLARIPGLRVIGRTSTHRFKGRNEDLRDIGRALGASYLVEGSVSRSGKRLRVTAQLIATQDASHVWAGRYDRDIDEVLQVQREIAGSLVRALQVAVGADLPSRPLLKSAAGYDFYQRGRHALDRFDKAGFESAESFFQQALALDPTDLRAAESLALVHMYVAEWGFAPPRQGFERARASCEAVFRLDPRSAMVHAQLALIHAIYDWDWTAALESIHRALDLDPRDPGILVTAGIIHLSLNRLEDATGFFNAACALDPLGAISHGGLGTVLYRLGRLDEAEAKLRTALELNPTYLWAHWTLGAILLAAGKLDAALVQMRKATPAGGEHAGLAIVYHAMGRHAESDAALMRATEAYAGHWAYVIAQAHAFRGEADEALTWLDRAYRQRDAALYRCKAEPLLGALAGDARYQAFLRTMNFRE